jgi:CBS domain-containing membrane protein
MSDTLAPVPAASPLLRWLATLKPAPLNIDGRERWRVAIGVGIGLLISGSVCFFVPHVASLPWLVAPLGASAVLVFGVPASPLAQPWSVVGGNTLSALVGIAFVHLLPQPVLAAALGTACAVALMLATRSLHPPGGAAALLTVLGGVTDWRFAFFPVLINSLLLVAAGMVYNQRTGRRYPHVQAAPPVPGRAQRFTDADLDAVLARYNQVLDVPRDDLRTLMEEAELTAHHRRLGEIRCGDIMSRDLATVEFGTSLQDAWTLLRERRIKSLPVIDRVQRVVGIVTVADFMRHAEPDLHDGIEGKLRRLIKPSTGVTSDKPEVVGQIMTRQVRVASVDRHIAELVPIFASTGHHHIPIIDGQQRLVGMVTQSDVVRALDRFADPR